MILWYDVNGVLVNPVLIDLWDRFQQAITSEVSKRAEEHCIDACMPVSDEVGALHDA